MKMKSGVKKEPKKKLTAKERKFVTEIVKGATKTEAYMKTYNTKGNKTTVHSEASRTASKPHVKHAIDSALELHGLTPEHAIKELKYIVDQNDEIGAKRLAIMNTLELHGWRKDERPQSVLQINNSFFSDVVPSKQEDVIDV